MLMRRLRLVRHGQKGEPESGAEGGAEGRG